MIYRFIISILLTITFHLTYAQKISGSLIDENQEAVYGAEIQLKLEGTHTHSAKDGSFTLQSENENDTLVIKHIGFYTEEVPIQSFLDLSTKTISLTSYTFNLSDVVIQKNVKSLNITSDIDLETNPVRSSQELLQIVPGLFIGQHAGGGKAEQIFMRGFDIDHGTDINLSIDNMPINMVSHAHGQGYSDMHFIIPETVDEIDYGKGSYYADKGNFTTAGYAEFKTKDRLKNSITSVEYGQFNTQRILSAVNLVDETNSSAYAALDYNTSDGWFESQQNFKRMNLFGKYTGYTDDKTKISLSLSHFNSSWDASGQIPIRAVNDGTITRFGAIDDTEGGNTSRTNLVLNTTHFIDSETTIRNTMYYTYYDFELYSNFTFFARDSINGDQIRQKESRNMVGGESQLEKRYEFTGFDLKLTGAVGFRYDDVNNNELSYTANRKTTLENVQLGDVKETNTFAYLNAEFNFGKWLLNPGVRFDYFNFNYINQLDSVYSSPSKDGGVFSPKLNIVYQATDNTQLYLKNGIGFHSNDTRVVVQENVANTIPLAYSSDLGVILKPTPSLLINAAVWQLFMEQEFVYVGDEGIVEPSGRTQRLGIDIGFRYELLKGLFLFSDLNYAYARAIDEPSDANYIPLAPSLTNTGGISYRSDKRISGSLRYRYIADRPANEDYSLTAEGYCVADLNINYDINKWQFGIIIQNLFNTEWKETQFATESQLRNETQPVEEIHFTPGIPFAVRGKISYRF